MTWHVESVASVAIAVATDVTSGLPGSEAARRLAADGPNTLVTRRGPGPLRRFLAQFADVLVILLLLAAAVAGAVGEPVDAAAILAIVVLNATFGFLHERRAERSLAALRARSALRARVRRDGRVQEIPAEELVRGDLVLLDAGNVVPADLRLVEVGSLRLDESILTGESLPVDKGTAPIESPDAALGDRRCMAYGGTTVTYGRGLGVVTATGMGTELGRIAQLLDETVETETPLQRRLGLLARRIGLAVVAISALIFAIGLLRGGAPVLMLLTALSLAVAAIPEALPAVVTASLALGARRMVTRQALVRRLPAVETLGSVTVICADKTGTLTENRLQVTAMDPADHPPLLVALALSNDAERRADGGVEGDPTEVALYEAAAARGHEKPALMASMPRVGEVPFSSERRMMTTLHRAGTEVVGFTKGSPERVLQHCAWRDGDGRPAAVREAVEVMAGQGLRVLAVATRRFPSLPADRSSEAIERDLTLLGLIGLEDRVRAEAPAALDACREAGIGVVLISGDHPATVGAVAERLGIARVHARATPAEKLDIVGALQREGEVVAMTGDGVNDAPALRQADIGVAMGRSGTDVAREAADLVLLDDNFATIVAAVREGRRIYDNIRKFVRYVLTCNSAELWTLLLAPFLGLPVPLLPIQILWVNVITDGLPGLALALEPEEADVMRRPPRPPTESMFAGGLWQHVLWVGLLMAGLSLLTLAWAYERGSPRWQSMTFTVLAFMQLAHLLAIRSERQPWYRAMMRNLPLLGAVVLTVTLQVATLYLPAFQRVFKTEALTVAELLVCVAISALVLLAVEGEKMLVRRGVLYRRGPQVARG